jgi:3-deoxy-7-phosphoheptulonate synthase
MICVFEKNINRNEIERLTQRCDQQGVPHQLFYLGGQYRLLIKADQDIVANWPETAAVLDMTPFTQKRVLTNSQFLQHSVIKLKHLEIGSNHFCVIAGPCSVENPEQISSIASIVKQFGGKILRGGAFKPRTSPYDFQGSGLQGLIDLKQAADEHGLLCISEVMDTRDVEMVATHVDIVQVGARNMQNFSLLRELGQMNKPVLLKRGLSATYEEWLSAAEYILSYGNFDVILCERGIRTFENYTRNTLDIAAVPILQQLTHLPIIVDPSHAVGMREFVPNLAYAAMAAGSHGIMVEVHTHPEKSISDARQTISPDSFGIMMQKLKSMSPIFDKNM